MTTAPSPWPAGEWRRHLAAAVRDPGELLEILELDASALGVRATPSDSRRFPLRVPRGFVDRMRRGDPADPLLRQVLPLAVEDDEIEGFRSDPVGEFGLGQGDGLLAKYHGRALLVSTGACAVHCRYCFRRHFPYDEHRHDGGEDSEALARIESDPSIEEIILSGGDPLVLPDERLAALCGRVSAVSHLKRLRIHTRMPVVLPERVDESLIEWVVGIELPVVMVIHANHPNEIDHRVARALAVLDKAGAVLLNQSVLLRGVNDDAGVLAALSSRLFDCGVLPYYIHLLDRVAGAAHFDVEENRARVVMGELRSLLPGYLLPRLVREIRGATSKVPID